VTRCLRKRAQDRYPDARELGSDLKTVQREIESGVSTKAPLAVRLREQWRSLRDRPAGELLLPAAGAAVGLAVVVALFTRADVGPGLVTMGVVGLLLWRRHRNRRLRLARKFVRKAARMPEVRLVTLDGMRLTLVADRAQAKTYVRANALLDSINASMFFGEDFTLVVRDGATLEEERGLLSGSGVLYVRDDTVARPGGPAA
jgi:hypothetical protein